MVASLGFGRNGPLVEGLGSVQILADIIQERHNYSGLSASLGLTRWRACKIARPGWGLGGRHRERCIGTSSSVTFRQCRQSRRDKWLRVYLSWVDIGFLVLIATKAFSPFGSKHTHGGACQGKRFRAREYGRQLTRLLERALHHAAPLVERRSHAAGLS